VGPTSDSIHTASGSGTATADCGVGHFVLGGGGSFTGGGGLLGQGTMTGSYPSDAAATPVTSGTARYWTVTGVGGGIFGGTPTVTTYAICSP
jgi:hypothetical protein